MEIPRHPPCVCSPNAVSVNKFRNATVCFPWLDFGHFPAFHLTGINPIPNIDFGELLFLRWLLFSYLSGKCCEVNES